MVHAKGQGYALAPISYAAALRISVVPRKVLSAVSFKKWYIPISSFFNLQFIEAQVPEQYFAEDTLHAPTMQTHSRTPLPSTQSYGKQYGIVSTDQDSLFIFLETELHSELPHLPEYIHANVSIYLRNRSISSPPYHALLNNPPTHLSQISILPDPFLSMTAAALHNLQHCLA